MKKRLYDRAIDDLRKRQEELVELVEKLDEILVGPSHGQPVDDEFRRAVSTATSDIEAYVRMMAHDARAVHDSPGC